MIKLDLKANTPEQEIVLKHFTPLVSDVLAEKINNGVYIEKDGKRLLNKKDLDTFMIYLAEQAKKKIPEKNQHGAQSVCMEGEDILSLAVHYFEEESIIGTLYNEDGTEYKPVTKPIPKKPAKATTPAIAYTPPKPQMSIFDMVDTSTEQVKQEIEEREEEHEDYSDCQIDTETGEIIRHEEEPKKVIKTMNTMAQKYFEIKAKYQGVVAMRLGDFYEVLGEDAVTIAEELNLTLTGRDIGLDERMPMIGFPYHAKDIYFSKIIESHKLLIVEDGETKEFTKPEPVRPIQPVIEEPAQEDDDDIDMYKSFNSAALATLLDKFGEDINIQ